MAGSVRLILALHNHQPIGNFDGVFEQSFRDSYQPFLDVMQDYPEIPFALHTSGSLLEWLEQHHPEYIERLRGMVASRQVEIIGGAFYEPILANIPRRDRIGQIRSYSEHLNQLFHTVVRGMWLPERVWEQTFAGDISAAGIQYTIVDDYHVRCAGVPQSELYGYYVTEDEGRLLNIFPGSERLRYLIPFHSPEKCIEFLREVSELPGDPVVVFGDDGEKFGAWPETFKHVYQDRWLRRFLDAVRQNESWIQVTTPAEVIDHVKPLGRCYIPDASYREMTEWVLEAGTQREFVSLTQERADNEDWQKLVRFTRGGFWRNFRTRYPESNEMYARMMDVSQRVALALADETLSEPARELLEEARLHLYRGQCNCAYWHGAFGGLYLPHLRNAIYRELIIADTLIDRAAGREEPWVDVATGDFDLDARQEVRMSNHRLVAWIAPARGGHLYELDLKNNGVNLLATLDRRPEAYHQKILDHGRRAVAEQSGEIASILEFVKFKQPDLDKKIAYDSWRRKSLVDHFLRPELTADEFRRGEGLIGDFAAGAYEASVRRGTSRVAVEMRRRGNMADLQGEVRKVVVVTADRPNELVIQYQLSDFPKQVPLHFAIELNFAAMPGGAEDRYYYDATGNRLGTLDRSLCLDSSDRLSLVDEWLGLDVSLELSKAGGIWTTPVETISQSEGGFELVHQSVSVVPHWEFVMPEDGPWVVDLRLVLDTSMATARQLVEFADRSGGRPAVRAVAGAVFGGEIQRD
jgi:4-alpha-glucanotransferase